MGVPTCLTDVDLNENNIDDILSKLKLHKIITVEKHDDVTLELSRKILLTAD